MKNKINYTNKSGIRKRALMRSLASMLIGAFLVNALICTDSSALAPAVGSRETFDKLRNMMSAQLSDAAHRETRDSTDTNWADVVKNGQIVMDFLASRAVYDVQSQKWKPIDNLDELVSSGPYDVVMVFGSGDLQVPEKGAEVVKRLREGNPDMKVVTSGKYGGIQQADAGMFFDETGRRMPEAERFRQALEGLRVWDDKNDMMEVKSTNTGQNIEYTRKLLSDHGLKPKRILVLQLPEAQLRAGLSLIKQYPDSAKGQTLLSMGVDKVANYAPHVRDISKMTEDELEKQIGDMLQELKCLREYPALGFMIPVEIPPHVLESEKELRTAKEVLAKKLSEKNTTALTLHARQRQKIPADAIKILTVAVPVMKDIMLNAGALVSKWRNKTSIGVSYKPDQESIDQAVVTEADFEVQTYILDQLESKLGFPFRVMAEETEGALGEKIEAINTKNGGSPFEIVIDPIDGTRQFINPESTYFGSLLSLMYHGDVIAAFFIGPEYEMNNSKGVFFEASELEDGTFVSGIREGVAFDRQKLSYDQEENNFKDRTVVVHRNVPGLFNATEFQFDRIGKSSGMALSLVAMGRKDNPIAYVDARRPIWDVSAGAYFVEKSGGVAVNNKGENILPFRPETLRDSCVLEIIAGHPKVVARILKSVQQSENSTEPLADPPVVFAGVEAILEMLPQEWRENNLKASEFLNELSALLHDGNVLEEDKSTFIFSERVTFDNGLGVLLPKLAKSGMRVAVIATNDRQRGMVSDLNRGNPENERIIYAGTIVDVMATAHTARYYYFKVTGDPDVELQGVTTFDITGVVKKIIDAIGKVCGIVNRERIDLLHQAARSFAEAA